MTQYPNSGTETAREMLNLLKRKYSHQPSVIEVLKLHKPRGIRGRDWDHREAFEQIIKLLEGLPPLLEALALPSSPLLGEGLEPDVVRLVIAARRVVEASDWTSQDRRERIATLDSAAEAFASRVPWDDEPEPEESAPPPLREEMVETFSVKLPSGWRAEVRHVPDAKDRNFSGSSEYEVWVSGKGVDAFCSAALPTFAEAVHNIMGVVWRTYGDDTIYTTASNLLPKGNES